MKQIPIRITMALEIATPIHIGDGIGFDYFDYIVKDGKLWFLDQTRFIESLAKNKLQEFISLCAISREDDMKKVKQFIKDNFFAECVRYSIPISERCKIDDLVFRRPIEKLIRNGLHDDIYIPGTSIKGAFRTAYLNKLAKNNKINNPSNRSVALENILMEIQDTDSHSDDPLRGIKFSDFLSYKGGSAIAQMSYRHSFSKEHLKGANKSFGEYILPKSKFIGSITIVENTLSKIKWSYEKIQQTLEDCFIKTAQEESKIFDIAENILPFDFNKKNTEMLIKLGKHSGAYSHIIKGNQQISVRDKGNHNEHQTTVWIIESQPMGWAKLHLVNQEEYDERLKSVHTRWNDLEQKYKQDSKLKQGSFQAEIQQLQQKQAEQKKQLEEEQEKQRLITLEQEKIANMSEEEKMIWEVENYTVTQQNEAKIGDYCKNKIEVMSEPNKQKLAIAIKEYFIKDNKWSGKLSPKQEEKVKKIKGILLEE